MKKIIRKKLYDTENGELVFQNNVGNFGDSSGYSEALYKNPDGFYFLHTIGGESSLYPKEDLKQISAANAERWVQETRK